MPIYVDDGGAIVEAVDIAGVASTFPNQRKIIDAWMPEMQKVMKRTLQLQIVGDLRLPGADFLLPRRHQRRRGPQGQKDPSARRVAGRPRKGFGASAVTIPFGEVVPALEKGVVDCSITGTMPAYKAKWQEVAKTLFRLPVGFTASDLGHEPPQLQ